MPSRDRTLRNSACVHVRRRRWLSVTLAVPLVVGSAVGGAGVVVVGVALGLGAVDVVVVRLALGVVAAMGAFALVPPHPASRVSSAVPMIGPRILRAL